MTKLLPLLMIFVLCGCREQFKEDYKNKLEKNECDDLGGSVSPITCELNRLNNTLTEIKELLKAQKGK